MKILVFDNYDSFTYNLVHLVEKILHLQVDVYRNDEIAMEDVAAYDKIILSPGPGIPTEAGMLLPLIKTYASTKPILGICLGHQAIGEAFGGELINLETVYHGVATPVAITSAGEKIFDGISSPIMAGRYHSWIIKKETLPECLRVTATDENGYIMGIQHKDFNVTGLQFHPESILTPEGENLISNWLQDAPEKK